MSTDNDDGEVNRVTTCEKKNCFIFFTLLFTYRTFRIYLRNNNKKK